MGFSRQLTSEEILEQVSRFAMELSKQERDGCVEDDFDTTVIHAADDGGRGAKRKNRSSTGNKNPRQQQHGRKKRLSNIVFMGMGKFFLFLRCLYFTFTLARSNQRIVSLSHAHIPFLSYIFVVLQANLLLTIRM